MAIDTVTFDFHNTIAQCDEWFQLEIRTLVQALLRRVDAAGTRFDDATLAAAVERYRALRLEIIQHGIEQDAYSCAVQILNELDIQMDEPAIESGIRELMRAALPDSQPIPGVVDTVKQLANDGLKLGIISNAIYHPFLEWSLEKFEIADAFDLVVTSASAGFYKSRTELYAYTIDALGSSADRTVHIGDSYRFDVLGAHAAGLKTVWFDTGHTEGTGEVADLRVTTLEGLADKMLDRFEIASP
ncbi:MAG: HAD family hydrolase [Thermomicrobiales bacterium]|nr:HAD family hydrolase [Thermomicrobiales bacterium]